MVLIVVRKFTHSALDLPMSTQYEYGSLEEAFAGMRRLADRACIDRAKDGPK